jgi:hypothetical protein
MQESLPSPAKVKQPAICPSAAHYKVLPPPYTFPDQTGRRKMGYAIVLHVYYDLHAVFFALVMQNL